MIDESYILTKIKELDKITPINIVILIQQLTGFSLDRAIKGYQHFAKSVSIENKFEEMLLFSPQLAHIMSLEPQVYDYTIKENNSLEPLKIANSDKLILSLDSLLSNVPIDGVDMLGFYKRTFNAY